MKIVLFYIFLYFILNSNHKQDFTYLCYPEAEFVGDVWKIHALFTYEEDIIMLFIFIRYVYSKSTL